MLSRQAINIRFSICILSIQDWNYLEVSFHVWVYSISYAVYEAVGISKMKLNYLTMLKKEKLTD